jgi:hypothetical protein
MLKSQHETPIINPDNSVIAVSIIPPAIMPDTTVASASIIFWLPFFGFLAGQDNSQPAEFG